MGRILIALSLVACGGDVQLETGGGGGGGLDASCSDGSPVDTYVAGLERTSDGGSYSVVMMDATPSPPDVGVNRFTLQIDGATGVVIKPWMPLHGHGSVPLTFDAIQEPDGIWVTPDIDLFMPGLWEIELLLTGTAEDAALYRFCLEG